MSAHDSLSPHQFSAQYKPSEYGDTWDDVRASHAFHHDPYGEHLTHDQMVTDLGKRGMKEPVQVYREHVVDGHHRALAAMDAGVPIRYEHAHSELYEGQIKS